MTAALNRPFPLPGVEVSVTASIGIAYAVRGDARTPEQLLHDADMAMYQAKHGAERVSSCSTRGNSASPTGRPAWNATCPRCSAGELHLEYQPIVDTADGRITGFEALLRWQHPTRGMVPPTTLIPLAEQSGLITASADGSSAGPGPPGTTGSATAAATI